MSCFFYEQGRVIINDRDRKYVIWGFIALAMVAAALFFSFVSEYLGSLTFFLGKVAEVLMLSIYGTVMAFLMAPTYQTPFVFVTRCLRPGGLRGPTEVKMDECALVKFRRSSSAKLFTRAERLWKKKNAERTGKIVATFACIIVILAVLIVLIAMLIPQLVGGVSDLTSDLSKGTNSVSGWIQMLLCGRNSDMKQMVLGGYRQIFDSLTQWISADFMPNLDRYLTQMTDGAVRLFVFLKSLFIGLTVMAYGLNMKEALMAQNKRFLFVLLSRRVANDTITELRYVKWVFSSFTVGEIIDSMTIGIVYYICMSFMKMSYVFLVSVFVGVANVIPLSGSFVDAVPSAFTLLMVSPITMLQFLTFILVPRQFDDNILGPCILGSTTSMSSFWVLFAILFLGRIWGIVGMVVDVPTFAALIRFMERALVNVLKKKRLPVEEDCYDALGYIDTGDDGLHYGRRDEKK